MIHGIENNALFLNRRGERLTRQGFWQKIKGYARDAELDSEITPHTLRHSFATHLVENGYSLSEVQILLGHNSPKTSMVYIHMANPGILNIKSPLDEL